MYFRLKAVRRLNADFEGNISKASREMGIDRKQLREWSKKEVKLANVSDKRTRKNAAGGRDAKFPLLENSSLLGLKIKGKVRICILSLSTLYNI